MWANPGQMSRVRSGVEANDLAWDLRIARSWLVIAAALCRVRPVIISDRRARRKTLLLKVRERAFAQVDIASLIFFRIAFGLLMVWEVWRNFSLHLIAANWIAPRFLFKFYGFSWVHPWPNNWLYIHWGALGLFAFFVAIGFLYRASAILLFLSYAYFFLLDESRYVNHTYLICLFSFLLIFVPAHRALSVDAWLNPKIRSGVAPAWSLWLLRAQIGVVYFYAGVAKISPDWLRGEPMRQRMAHNNNLPIVGRFFREEWAVYGASYGGLLLDLFIVPLLLWRRTRVAAFFAAVLFHLINARWFNLGIFPWLAIAATALFLSPTWPRQILAFFGVKHPFSQAGNWQPPPRRQQLITSILVTAYLCVQILVPLRHLLQPGGFEWMYAEHRFSWRMMLLRERSTAYFYVTDPNVGRTMRVVPQGFLNDQQRTMLPFLPDYPLQFAHYLAAIMPRKGPMPLIVEARIFLSINGRKPELMIDPNVDLAAEPRTLGRPRWLMPIREPLPPPGQESGEVFGPLR